MKHNTLVGSALIASALALAALCAALGSSAAPYCGKSLWYLPYAALVAGLARICRG